jgi:hypothetical protein
VSHDHRNDAGEKQDPPREPWQARTIYDLHAIEDARTPPSKPAQTNATPPRRPGAPASNGQTQAGRRNNLYKLGVAILAKSAMTAACKMRKSRH